MATTTFAATDGILEPFENVVALVRAVFQSDDFETLATQVPCHLLADAAEFAGHRRQHNAREHTWF
jgi:hypothetical protein